MSAVRIRHAQWPRDEDAAREFIMGSQHFEHAVEPNRRLDPPVASEHLAKLKDDVARHGGCFLVAVDDTDRALGWAVAHEDDDDAYVLPQERRFVYISELFVVEAARGTGVGRVLIAACEDWARRRGIGVMHIAVLSANTRAAGIYTQAGYAPYSLRLRKYLT
jgi:GNAT superfamily N-acetyltransferase